jgi:hypothetical protein
MDLNVVNLPKVDRKDEPADLKVNFLEHIRYTLAKDRYTATRRDLYDALACREAGLLPVAGVHDWPALGQ